MTSEVFELVANDDQRFFVHEAILSSQSTSFQNTSERTINLRDWNSDTVARLVEFLYCRNYDYPDPTLLEPRAEHSLSETVPPAQADSEVTDPRRPLTPLQDCLGSSLALDEAPRTDAERIHSFDPSDCDFEGILLAHAKVYALANSKSVITLQTLALRRLLLTLSHLHPLQPHSHISKNIVDFARYVYASKLSMITDYLGSSEESLKKLTSQLIALNFAAFQSEPRAVELIAEGGDLVRDVMAKVSRRLSDPVGVFWNGGHSKEVRYISGITAVRDTTPPSDHVQEASGMDSNVNYKLTGSHTVWFVPEYTTIAADACTSFVVSPHFTGNSAGSGPLYYVDAVKDENVPAKIIEVLLYRITIPCNITCSALGFDGMTGDIRNLSTSDPLYLVWTTTRND
ncbi:hypothetical protein Q9L58_009403 [Maublancomyces gigas]|uniref:BTB domain-containing protein n=1 Tax=Discina gigas TaxID=1032678 RepID=A0ABR3G786_9PEZI